jgi:hypothetical protein
MIDNEPSLIAEPDSDGRMVPTVGSGDCAIETKIAGQRVQFRGTSFAAIRADVEAARAASTEPGFAGSESLAQFGEREKTIALIRQLVTQTLQAQS